jgi:hypothetical protein
MNKWKFVRALLVVVFLPAISGCRRDPVVEWLEYDKEKAKAKGHPDIEQRCVLCLSKWQNRTLDPEPILVTAPLVRTATESGRWYLSLEAFDEDKDTVGVGIREEYTDVNGLKTGLTEEYAAFVHQMMSEVMRLLICPVQIRDADQRKDAQRWDQYVKGEGIHASRPLSAVRWRETLPPVWVSVPEPNRVDVYVYVYDQAGHKSNLLPPLREGDYTPSPEELFWRKVRMDRQRSLEKVP